MGLRLIFADGTLIVWGVGLFIVNFGGFFVNGLLILCIFDSRVYGKWKTGIDNDAVLMSGSTTSSKVGFAITGSLAGILLSAVNYDSALEQQTEAVLNLLFTENVVLPFIGYIIVAIFAFFVRRIEKKIPQMRAELEARESAGEQNIQ